jgi:uncharacterized protein YprB with RNaseH-like and TPR domain
MASNLKDRLNRIHELKKNDLVRKNSRIIQTADDYPALKNTGWKACGYKVLKREVIKNTPFNIKNTLPRAAAIIIPDLAGKDLSTAQDFVFFDLETSGLSGGAGTIAFLAAFGRLLSNRKISITQYLLLDYPGENDFIDAVLKEFENENSVIVTFNGKCFDSQILKTRCFMNRIKPPRYFHADLLHPARRLWKNIIQDCSQSSIETKITGINRSDDIPGSLAPEVWFEFLKTGRTDRLIGICDHNSADILGLASILAAMVSIAQSPLNSDFIYDIDRIALYWRDFCRRQIRGTQICRMQNDTELRITGDKLLRLAADSIQYLPNKKAAVFRALAIDSERRLKNPTLAIEFTKRGLKLKETGQFWKEDFEHRLERLKKLYEKNI